MHPKYIIQEKLMGKKLRNQEMLPYVRPCHRPSPSGALVGEGAPKTFLKHSTNAHSSPGTATPTQQSAPRPTRKIL